jgi:tetratricopeptide (TPR) repeat protein/transcriptional regulator with XRE-family HTH domain
MPSFAALVRTWRARALLTQEQLALRAGLGVRTIRRLETEAGLRPRHESVKLLAKALSLTDAEQEQLFAAAREDPAGRPPADSVPRQLPADLAGFTGRRRHLRELDALLAGDPPTAVVISAIAGTAGVGKTALAVHWAHRVTDRFPDGQLYVNLRGFDPSGRPSEPAAAVRGLLDALGAPPQGVPADPQAQFALYRTLLAGRRMLVVLDNARDAEQVRPLLPGAPGCLALVTSRNLLTGLVASEGAHPLTLDVLSTVEARDLLARRLGADRVAREPDAVEEIVAFCARLPLALAVVAAYAAIHPDLPLSHFAVELQDTEGRLDSFETGDRGTDVRAVFSWSYNSLHAAAARVFRLLGLHPGPDISAVAAASLAGDPLHEVQRSLADLARANLITEPRPGRYALHDLLRAYARELAQAVEPDAARHAAEHRMLDHYLHSAHTAALSLNPNRAAITVAEPRPGTNPEEPTDAEQAMAWFTTEHPVLLAVIEHAATGGWDAHIWQLSWSLADFSYRRGHWHAQITADGAAIAAARRLGDHTGQALCHRNLAKAFTQLNRYGDAHTHLRHALDLLIETGDRAGQASTHESLALVSERQEHYAAALEHAEQALALHRAAGNEVGQANAINQVGWYHALLGNHREALTNCGQALTLFQQLGSRPGQAATWDSLGYAHHHLGEYDKAIACYGKAIDLIRDIGSRYAEAEALGHLGDAHHAAGNADPARDAWREAVTILDGLDHPEADRIRGKLGS